MTSHPHKKTAKKLPSGHTRVVSAKQASHSDTDPGAHSPVSPHRKKSKSHLSSWIGVITWGCFFWILDRVKSAMPESSTFFTRMFELNVRSNWDMSQVSEATTWMLVLALVSLINMATGVARNGGKYRVPELASLVLAGIACALALWLMRVE
ncbi:MAG: hypothetical protein HQL07_13780 [Nitrospirae bacterium]|nr:hypothetical protein [Magnetococcales bacterium]